MTTAANPVSLLIALCFCISASTASALDQTTQESASPTNADAARATPEAATGMNSGGAVRGAKAVVVAANPIAARVGAEILNAGGSAADAAIAVQLVLNSVEPQSSGLGGGGFALYWDNKAKKLTTIDGRETAPAAAKSTRFLKPDGSPMDFMPAVRSGRSIGVPGLARMLEVLHESHGKLPWPEVVTPAIKVAADGFKVSPRLNRLLAWRGAKSFGEKARELYFGRNGKPRPVGYRLRNPDLARTLATLQREGAESFYSGTVSKDIIASTKGEGFAPLTTDDLSGYTAKLRQPVCVTYRAYKVCGMGPPSSGGTTVLQALKILERYDLGKTPLEAESLHFISEASKLAFADRNRYSADPDFVPVNIKGLLDPSYLASRAALISPKTSMGTAKPGKPPHQNGALFGVDSTFERPGTTHFSIIDKDGNAVAITSSIETAFGSHRMAGGFFLNNQLTDFSFRPSDDKGVDIANRVEGGKRPRSSMAPTMVFDQNGELWAVLGSPGGSRIIGYVLKSVVGLIDWGLSAQEAATLVNFTDRNGPFEVEAGTSAPGIVLKMTLRGHATRVVPMTSGLHIAVRREEGWEGGADPRREGVAIGLTK